MYSKKMTFVSYQTSKGLLYLNQSGDSMLTRDVFSEWKNTHALLSKQAEKSNVHTHRQDISCMITSLNFPPLKNFLVEFYLSKEQINV